MLAAAGSDCNIHLHKMLPTTNSATDFFCFSCGVSKGMAEQQLVAPMRKAGDLFGPKPPMISNRPVLVLIKGGGGLNLPTFIFM